MRHQQEFLKALMDKAASTGTLTNPKKLNDFLKSVDRAVTVDQDFSLVDMALQFRSLRGENLTFVTSPNSGSETINGESVVVSDREKALAMYKAMSADTMADWVKANPPKGNDRRLTDGGHPRRRPPGGEPSRSGHRAATIDCNPAEMPTTGLIRDELAKIDLHVRTVVPPPPDHELEHACRFRPVVALPRSGSAAPSGRVAAAIPAQARPSAVDRAASARGGDGGGGGDRLAVVGEEADQAQGPALGPADRGLRCGADAEPAGRPSSAARR